MNEALCGVSGKKIHFSLVDQLSSSLVILVISDFQVRTVKFIGTHNIWQQRELNIIIVQKNEIFSFSFRKLGFLHYLCIR